MGGLTPARGTPPRGRLAHHPQDPRVDPGREGSGSRRSPALRPVRARGARWTHDSAQRIAGWKAGTPESVQEKADAIHDLADDDQAAARVATDFLRRPAVASKAMADDTARHPVNEAQSDRFRQEAAFVHDEAAPLPQPARLEHNVQFMDLAAARTLFTVTVGRIVPKLREAPCDDAEHETALHGLSRVRVSADWTENAVTRGEADLDEQLQKLLKGSGEQPWGGAFPLTSTPKPSCPPSWRPVPPD